MANMREVELLESPKSGFVKKDQDRASLAEAHFALAVSTLFGFLRIVSHQYLLFYLPEPAMVFEKVIDFNEQGCYLHVMPTCDLIKS